MNVKSPQGSALYDLLAAAYDLSGQSRFSLKMVGYMLEILALRRIKPTRLADLACGTGAAAVALARRKFTITGVDGSSGMLKQARARADRWRVAVDWRQADLADLAPPEAGGLAGLDLAMCLYDSLNHLTDPVDLRRALLGIRRMLVPGGLFFFDVNTPHAYASVWGEAEDSYLSDRHARFWRSHYDGATGLATLNATYFVNEAYEQPGNCAPGRVEVPPTGAWRRIDVVHHARGYDDETVRTLLAEAGFALLESYEALTFEPVTPRTYRAAYLVSA